MKLGIPDTIVSFNAKVGRGGKAVIQSTMEILDDNPGTDVIVYQEAEGYVDDLRRRFERGWNVYARGGRPESRMNPVMVRKHDAFPRRQYGAGWGVVSNNIDWIGPKHGLKHEGRTWTWVKVGQVYVMSLHRVTAGDGKNKKAYQEEATRLINFMERGNKPRNIIVFGDTNTGYKATHDGSMRDIRAQVKGRLISDQQSPGIDYALTTASIKATMQRTKQYGSDHKAAVMRGIKVV